MLKIYNTIKKKKVEFKPIKDKEVNMYVCGITPYSHSHVGHARCYTVFDVIRRYLEFIGYKVKYVQNFTDIDDKIINKSNEEGISTQALSQKFIEEYFEVMDKLNIKRPDVLVKVTENIDSIISTISKLIEKDFAYVCDGDVYFRVKKFDGYGKLSGKNIEDLEAGARIDINKKKDDPLDFALWKNKKDNEPFWDSPWGSGRPGWHIECSAIATKYLGETLDIHGGGMDLIFPHHENERAQSICMTGKTFANFWIHNGFVTINKEKMSKSLGNIFDLVSLFKTYDPMVLRMFLVSQHYKSPIDFSDNKLKENKKRLESFNDLKYRLKNYTAHEKIKNIPEIDKFEKEFIDGMNDDFNTAIAIASLHKMLDFANKLYSDNQNKVNDTVFFIWKKIEKLGSILGLFKETQIDKDLEKYIEEQIKLRNDARLNKDFKTSDTIRDELKDKGIVLEDTKDGTIYKIN